MVLASNEEGMIFTVQFNDFHSFIVRASGNEVQALLFKLLDQSRIDFKAMSMSFLDFYKSFIHFIIHSHSRCFLIPYYLLIPPSSTIYLFPSILHVIILIGLLQKFLVCSFFFFFCVVLFSLWSTLSSSPSYKPVARSDLLRNCFCILSFSFSWTGTTLPAHNIQAL